MRPPKLTISFTRCATGGGAEASSQVAGFSQSISRERGEESPESGNEEKEKFFSIDEDFRVRVRRGEKEEDDVFGFI